MPEWSAEVTVDEPLARRLIAEQFPDLALDSLTLLGEGWDNTVWLVDAQWVFRFPRRTTSIRLFTLDRASAKPKRLRRFTTGITSPRTDTTPSTKGGAPR